MASYQLYCFGESGNAYKAALMLELCKADWQPVFVNYFKGQTRTPEYRSEINEMGEVPVLVDGARKLTQSGVILDYLAGQDGRNAGHRIPAPALQHFIEDCRWPFGGAALSDREAPHHRGLFAVRLHVLWS
jgi:glutathione S-transferase